MMRKLMKLLLWVVSFTASLLFSMEQPQSVDMHCSEVLSPSQEMDVSQNSIISKDHEICLKTYDSNGSYPVHESAILSIAYLAAFLADNTREILVPDMTMDNLKLCLISSEFYLGLKKLYPTIETDDQLSSVYLCPFVAQAFSRLNLVDLLVTAERLELEYLKKAIFYFICIRGLARCYVGLLTSTRMPNVEHAQDFKVALARMDLLCNRVSVMPEEELGSFSLNELKMWNILPRNIDEFRDLFYQDTSSKGELLFVQRVQNSNSRITLDILKKALKQSYRNPEQKLIKAWFIANGQILVSFAQLCAEHLIGSDDKAPLLKKCDGQLLDLIKKQFFLMRKKWLNPRYETNGPSLYIQSEFAACQEVTDPQVLFNAPLDVQELIDWDWNTKALGDQLFLNYSHLSDCHGLVNLAKKQITCLTLSNNRLSQLRAEDFRSFDLEILNVNHNRISIIEPEMFEHMKKLKALLLSHNLLESLPEQMFSYLPHLETLDLNNNRLESFSSMRNYLEKIQTINLQANRLSTEEKRRVRLIFPMKVHIKL